MNKIIIIGAGITGLTSAYFLKKPYEVLESKQYAGGLCASYYKDGFTFDCSGHFIHLKDEKIKKFVNRIAGGVFEVKRNACIYIDKTFVPYPFQANLSYLSDKIKKDCLDGIIKRKSVDIHKDMSFLNWSKSMFGDGITKYFMEPYNKKLWSYNLNKLNATWVGQFVPKPDAEDIIRSASVKNKKKYGYNSVFYYPKQNGCGALIDGLLKKVKVNFNSKTTKIDIKNKVVYCKNGKCYKYNKIISTQPLLELLKQIKSVPKSVKITSEKLLYSSVRCINIGVKSTKGVPEILKGKHWIYVPESKFSFYRIGIYSNVNPKSAPKHCYNFYVEHSSFSNIEYNKNTENIIKDLKKISFIRDDDKIIAHCTVDIPYAYVIFDKNKEKSLKEINDFLIKNNIFSIGRYGAWEYSFIEKNISDAKNLVEKLNYL
ncbi:MAG: NAD(P)-binding protein [Endomicrobium sp.]|jgi:protoporphyrinogen oxidase|uniref:protoporphyrinogen/coproporphyrinogen oxidase n=1 Tax=Candidatus Endomicrobiellum cubanum TaxID=3242325 RepID=UPI002831CCDF|nr:NAD(P)-binding protein [Endomicrobium sp.]